MNSLDFGEINVFLVVFKDKVIIDVVFFSNLVF